MKYVTLGFLFVAIAIFTLLGSAGLTYVSMTKVWGIQIVSWGWFFLIMVANLIWTLLITLVWKGFGALAKELGGE